MAGTIVAGTLSDGTYSGSVTHTVRGACRAWVNFNGTGTVAIRASYNVSSITDNGTGDYTVNFTNAMPDTNFSVSGVVRQNTTGGTGHFMSAYYSQTVSYVRVATTYVNNGFFDQETVFVQIFR